MKARPYHGQADLAWTLARYHATRLVAGVLAQAPQGSRAALLYSEATTWTADSRYKCLRERARLSTVLLHKMAKVLRIRIEQLGILDGVYYPVGVARLEADQDTIRRFLVSVAKGCGRCP